MPPRIHPPTSLPLSKPSPHTHCSSCLARAFSFTPKAQTRRRNQMFAWLHGPGAPFREPVPNSTNYLSAYDMRTGRKLTGKKSQAPQGGEGRGPEMGQSADSQALAEAAQDDSKSRLSQGKESKRELMPFPLNPHFVSQSVLCEGLRLEIWKRVHVDKKSVRQVSVELGIEMRRVGAVVRLVEVEKKMKAENQPLALPYAHAIHATIPLTPLTNPPTPHEPINDLPHHPLTAPQLFYPTSESRPFNRTDAGRVFSAAPRLPDSQDIGQGGTPIHQPWEDTTPELIGRPLTDKETKKGNLRLGEIEVLKPADARIPHPHLIAHELDKLSSSPSPSATTSRLSETEIQSRYAQRLAQAETTLAKTIANQALQAEKTRTRIQSERWEWVVQDVKSEVLGKGVVGSRYGVPSQERKKGQVKIPRKVEV